MDETFADQLVDVIEMGIPLTAIANSLQLASVMEGKHNIDVGILLMPILIELLELIADKTLLMSDLTVGNEAFAMS